MGLTVTPFERWRALLVWLLCAGLGVLYLCLPEGEDPSLLLRDTHPGGQAEHRLSILSVSPNDPAAGSLLAIAYADDSQATPEVWIGKTQLRVLAQRPGSLVAQLPDEPASGTVKLRLVQGNERSKPHELQIKPVNWQKLLRNAAGGLALLMLGVQVLARGARAVLSVANAQRMAALTRSRLLMLSLGALLGASMQSTTLAAGLLAGAAGSQVLSVTAAACLFLGAQLGAALAPWWFGSITEPRSGLILIALAALSLGLLRDRRDRSLARLLLGAGLVAFGVQVLRPGFEPFASNPFLLDTLDRLSPDGLWGDAVTALLGALLVAVFQGPSPVLARALGVAETTGHSNLRTTLVLLAGSGLGASLGALLAWSVGTRCRRLAEVSLVAGACSTLVSLMSLPACSWLSEYITAASPHAGLRWGKHVLPGSSWHISVTFGLTQLVAAGVVLPLLPHLPRWLASLRQRRLDARQQDEQTGVLSGLTTALDAQARALPEIFELALHGVRTRGRAAELALRSARETLLALLSGPIVQLPKNEAGTTLARSALAGMQLQRALEDALRAAELLTESRVVEDEHNPSAPIAPASEATLRQMHSLLAEGLDSLRASLTKRSAADADEIRTREIELNLLESEARRTLLHALLAARPLQESLELLALSDAYEVAGNQLFRMADILEQGSLHALDATTEQSVSLVPARE
mgnify:CR=1 FL=1